MAVDPTDYLDRLGVTMNVTPTHCMVVHGVAGSAMFPGIAPDTLRDKLNDAMHVAAIHYDANVSRSDVQISRTQIEEAALAVVISTLYVYNQWRQIYAEHPLHLAPSDLTSVQAHDQCWFYCQRVFGKRYLPYAAALTGMSQDAFQQYEQGRRRHFDR